MCGQRGGEAEASHQPGLPLRGVSVVPTAPEQVSRPLFTDEDMASVLGNNHAKGMCQQQDCLLSQLRTPGS